MSYATAVRRLPLRSPEEIFGDSSLVVVAPHPDDETLGCGGLLAWASQHRIVRHIVFLTDGDRSHPGSMQDLPGIRRSEAVAAAAQIGCAPEQLSFLGLPDDGLTTLSDDDRRNAVQHLRALIADKGVCCCLVTAQTDPHGDHRAAFGMVTEAIEGLPGVTLMTYPIWSWLLEEAPPDIQGVRIAIGEYRPAKTAAIQAYASQLGSHPLDVEGFVLPEELMNHVNTDVEIFLSPEL